MNCGAKFCTTTNNYEVEGVQLGCNPLSCCGSGPVQGDGSPRTDLWSLGRTLLLRLKLQRLRPPLPFWLPSQSFGPSRGCCHRAIVFNRQHQYSLYL